MTAQEYLTKLQDLCEGLSSETEESFLKRLEEIRHHREAQTGEPFLKGVLEELNHLVEELDPTFKSRGGKLTSTVMGDALIRKFSVQPLLASLPEGVSKQLASVPVGTLPTLDPNAWAIRAPDGNPIVVIDQALGNALSHYWEVLHGFGGLVKSQGMTAADQFMDEQFRRLIDYFEHRGQLFTAEMPTSLPLSAFVSVQAGTRLGEIFVIAHEFAHIHSGHLEQAGRVPLRGMAGRELGLELFQKSQEDEFEADEMAMEWMLRFCKWEYSDKPAVGFTPALMALEIFRLFCLIEANRTRKPEFPSHPSPLVRLERLLAKFDDRFAPSEKEHARGLLAACRATPKLRGSRFEPGTFAPLGHGDLEGFLVWYEDVTKGKRDVQRAISAWEEDQQKSGTQRKKIQSSIELTEQRDIFAALGDKGLFLGMEEKRREIFLAIIHAQLANAKKQPENLFFHEGIALYPMFRGID